MKSRNTSWQPVAKWYNRITENGKGHYYHQHVIIPSVLRLLDISPKFPKFPQSPQRVLDVACGNGVLAKNLPGNVEYTGVDISPSLIAEAKKTDRNPKHKYFVADATNLPNSPNFPNHPNSFTHATIILALQNIRDPKKVLENVSKLLIANCKLLIVLNHPCFRIPRQSSWGVDEARKIQYRRVDKYMSPMEIPVNPVDFKTSQNSQTTLSYHFPLSYFISTLSNLGFLIENLEEWASDKESVGKAGKMENRARVEIPLFMAILAIKK